MKSKTKEKIAKWFAAVVIVVMIFQVLLPLFSSGVIESTKSSVLAPGTNTATKTITAVPSPQTSLTSTPKATITPTKTTSVLPGSTKK